MINLERFFKNIFATKEVSDDKLYNFADDHRARLAAQNPVDPLLAATNTKADAFQDARSGKDVNFAQQQAKTILMNEKMNAFKSNVSIIANLINYTYASTPSTIQEFFPLGVTEYSDATLGNIETLMDRMVDRILAHVGDLGGNNHTLFDALKNDFIAARDAQLAKFGAVESFDTVRRAARTALELQLLTNLCTKAAAFPGEIHRLNDFFDQSIIRSPGQDEEGILTGTVAANSTMNIENAGITAESSIRLKNTGLVDLLFCLTTSEAVACVTGVTLHPTEEVTVTPDMLGGAVNAFLNVTNPSPSQEGSWEAEVV